LSRGFEKAGLQPKDLARQYEIHDLAIAIVKDFVSKQPAVMIDEHGAVVPSGHHDIFILTNVPDFAFLEMEVPAHQSMGARCRVGPSREKGAAIVGVSPHYSAPGPLFPNLFSQSFPLPFRGSAQWKANCRTRAAARRAKGMGRTRLV
jgi:hypothetical protein